MTQTATQAMKPIPRVPGLPLLGNYPEHQRDRLSLYLRAVREYGDVVQIGFGPYPFLLFNRTEFARLILVDHAYDFDKGEYMHNAFRPAIGNGLFISEGGFHRHQRKLIAPSFQPRHIENYANDMVAYSERIQQTWHDGEMIDVAEEMTHLTSNATQCTSFSLVG
jgi:cytochrome P450